MVVVVVVKKWRKGRIHGVKMGGWWLNKNMELRAPYEFLYGII
jgi:hypothetical protein